MKSENQMADRRAFTLVELIGVVAVIFILALAVMPAMLKQMYDVERTKEQATLQALGAGLHSYVLSTRIIPGTNTIATDLANQLGWAAADVRTNGRGVLRYFILDPATRIGTNAVLPYVQTNILAANLPTNQPTNRFLIVTTLRSVLPVSVTRGCATNTVAFQNAWDSDEGVRPASWSDGDWGDILIQRVNLQSLFQQVILNSIVASNDVSYPATNGEFSLDVTNNHAPLPRTPFSAYVLQGTRLGLHANGGGLQVLQVIQGAGGLTNGAPFYPAPSFVYEKGNAGQGAGSWRGKLFLTTAAQQLKGPDLQGAYEVFMSGPVRANAGGVTQATLTWNFYNYMSNYVTWASNSFSASKKTAVSNSFNAIKSDLSYYCK